MKDTTIIDGCILITKIWSFSQTLGIALLKNLSGISTPVLIVLLTDLTSICSSNYASIAMRVPVMMKESVSVQEKAETLRCKAQLLKAWRSSRTTFQREARRFKNKRSNSDYVHQNTLRQLYDDKSLFISYNKSRFGACQMNSKCGRDSTKNRLSWSGMKPTSTSFPLISHSWKLFLSTTAITIKSTLTTMRSWFTLTFPKMEWMPKFCNLAITQPTASTI